MPYTLKHKLIFLANTVIEIIVDQPFFVLMIFYQSDQSTYKLINIHGSQRNKHGETWVVIAFLAVQLGLSIGLRNRALAISLSNKALQTGVAKALQKTLKESSLFWSCSYKTVYEYYCINNKYRHNLVFQENGHCFQLERRHLSKKENVLIEVKNFFVLIGS